MQKKIKDSCNLKNDVVDALVDDFCTNYCRFTAIVIDEEELEDICEDCPLRKLQERD